MDDLLTARQAAETLGRSVSTVHRLRANGQLREVVKAAGLRGMVLFRRADVEALAAQQDAT